MKTYQYYNFSKPEDYIELSTGSLGTMIQTVSDFKEDFSKHLGKTIEI